MALVLAIEPDLRQAEILTRIVREKVKADVVIVDSRDAAMEAMRTAVPDVMLLSALLSPRDEDELVGHLRRLEGAEHLQTHTIPQLASSGGDGPSGPARGLLKAFRRKKEAAPPVSGCDPDLFAQEIRVFLEQAEQKRHERAEELKYRPATAATKAAVDTQAKPAPEEPEIPAPTTSWDSPFEWRKSDTAPVPFAAFEEEPPAPKFQPAEEPAAEADFSWSAHLLDPSSLRGGNTDPEPPASPAADLPMAPDHLLEAHPETIAEPQPFEMGYAASPEPEPLETREAIPEPSVVQAPYETIAEAEVVEPDPEPAEAQLMAAQPAELTSEPEASEAPIAEFAQEAGAVVMQQGEAPPLDLRSDDFANERLDAPELFETFLPAVADLPVAVAADALPALDTVAEVEEIPQVEDILQVAGPAAPAIATPEEIEAYGRFEAPVASASAKPVSSFAVEESFSIECIIDPEPAHEEPAVSMPPPVEAASGPVAASDEEEIDLSWAVDNLQFETAPAEALQKPEKTADVEASEFESTELALTQGEAEETASTDEAAEEPPAKRPPVYLGPLATWARLERKTDEERRPGSDMREIIERLAVPPHIAGVSYARGVRIRRVRVAGARDRRRPADQSGPVILSRRALAETRSVAP